MHIDFDGTKDSLSENLEWPLTPPAPCQSLLAATYHQLQARESHIHMRSLKLRLAQVEQVLP